MSRNELVSRIPSLGVAWISIPLCQERGQKTYREELQQANFDQAVGIYQQKEDIFSTFLGCTTYLVNAYDNIPSLYSQTPPDQTPPPTPEQNPPSPPPEQNPPPPTPEQNPPSPPPEKTPPPSTQSPTPSTSSTPENPPQLESQPADLPQPSAPLIEQRLQVPQIDHAQRLEKLLQRLEQNKQASTESNFGELGKLVVGKQQLEQQQPPTRPEPQPRSIGYLQGHVGYFHTNNIFSSKVNPTQDGLIYSGLTLASTPIPLGNRTYLNGSINGYLMRYISQSKYNYNQVRFNASVYQQLSPQMYGEIGWSNQQLFYARNGNGFDAGDRFLNENSFRLSLGRRDPLTPKLMLDSFYELRFSLTDPPSLQDNRDRLIHSVWVSFNYYLQQSLQIGLDYQFSLSDFTRRDREDQYHRLYGHFTYGTSNYTNLSLQGGVTVGGSSDRTIDVDGWFFSINYNLELGRF
ncbi:hypothetical protein [Brasilonema sp. UFV-L1]|nr:hypothetical protein [Brasilonema sp. UFV-L1]